MKYRNKATGAVIDVNSELAGDWEPVKAPTPCKEAPASTGKKVPAKKTPTKPKEKV